MLINIRHKRDRFWKQSMSQIENTGFLFYLDYLPVDFLPRSQTDPVNPNEESNVN